MNFEIASEQAESGKKTGEILRNAWKDFLSDNISKVKANRAEAMLSLSAQAGLVFLFLNQNMEDLRVFLELPNTDEVVFMDKRVMALVLSHALVRSADKLKEFFSHEQNRGAVEPAV